MTAAFIKELSEVWKRQKRNWRIVVIRQIFNRFFNEMTQQYANIYVTLLGASPVELGLVNSVLGVAQSLISIPLGLIRDRFNLRKIYLIGVAMLMFVPLLYAVANGWQMIAIAILISGFGSMIGSCVVICDLSLPTKDRATGKSLCEGIGALPTILAPTTAAILITLFGGININSISNLYWIQFAVAILLFFYVWKNLSDIERPNNIIKGFNVLKEFGEIFTKGIAVKRWLLFQSINMFTTIMLFTFRYPYIYEIKGATQYVIGGTATAMLIAEVLFSTVIGRMADRIGRKKAFYILIPIFSAANIVLILASSSEWIILSGFLMGFRTIASFSYGSMTPELVPPEFIGRWRGLIGLFTGLVSIPAPIIGGFIWENFGPEWVFISVTVIDLLVRTPLLITVPETLNNQNIIESE
ncbi:MFS transporter [Candidatus Bathyarchaeota archaeon]|nr:MFS transporter [Candidatus Bathyarchaeota archaeon]